MSDAGTAWIWSAGIIGLAVGVGVGFLVAFLTALKNKRASKLQEELDRHKADFETYRTKVDEHFIKTSELFQDMTKQYRALYEHLATGAQALCTDQLVTHRLTVPESGPMVEHKMKVNQETIEGTATDAMPESPAGQNEDESASAQPASAQSRAQAQEEATTPQASEMKSAPKTEDIAAETEKKDSVSLDDMELESMAPRPTGSVSQKGTEELAADEAKGSEPSEPPRAKPVLH
jgi:uncharacterized membrane-anchored protein YhcB (DUF1043 family)